MPNTRNWLVLAGELSGYTFDLFTTIKDLGNVDVRFLYSPLDGLASFKHESAVEAHKTRLRWQDTTWLSVRKFVREPRPDAVFLYGSRPRTRLAMALSQLPRLTPLYYAADTNIMELEQTRYKRYFRKLSYWQACYQATAALSLGDTNRQALRAVGFSQIVDLPVYSVDFEALDSAARSTTSGTATNDERLTLVCIARLVPQKNLPAFVSVLAIDHELCRHIRLNLIGDGPEREALEMIKLGSPHLELNLLGAVPRAQIGSHLAQADALLLPSRTEPWGIVVVEALGMGLPVIASSVVGAATSLVPKTSGVVLAASHEPYAMLAAIREFLDRRGELAARAKAAIPFIRAHYGRIAVAKAHLQLVYGESWENPR